MDKKAECLTEIIELIKDQFKFLTEEDDIQNLWFRAEKLFIPFTGKLASREDIKMAKPCTPLLPNAYRKYGDVSKENNILKYEEAKETQGNLIAEFSRNATMFLNQNRIENNDWNKYFLMQHYGLSTRLLDWTESALVAIYFAVKDDDSDNQKIWILNPHNLNNSAYKLNGYKKNSSAIYFPQRSEKEDLFDKDEELNFDELCRRYLKMDFDSEQKAYPLAIYPFLFDERMKVQKSCFTIFGNQVNGLLDNPDNDKFLKSIVIDGNMKSKIKEELRWLGISEESVYPGLGSNCKTIQERYK